MYDAMWGPFEWRCTGTLRDVDLEPPLPQVDVPVLVLCGRHDDSTPAAATQFVEALSQGQLHVLEESAHCGIVEEPDAYAATVTAFLRRHDADGET